MARVNVYTANSGTSSVSSQAISTTATAGNLLIMAVATTGNSTNVNTPSGWTALDQNSSGGVIDLATFSKTAAGNDSVTVGLAASQRCAVTIEEWTNPSIDQHSLATGSGSTAFPTSLTPTQTGDDAVIFNAIRIPSATTPPITTTPGSGWTEENPDNYTSKSGSTNAQLNTQYQTGLGTGSVSDSTGLGASENYAAALILLNPASGSSGTQNADASAVIQASASQTSGASAVIQSNATLTTGATADIAAYSSFTAVASADITASGSKSAGALADIRSSGTLTVGASAGVRSVSALTASASAAIAGAGSGSLTAIARADIKSASTITANASADIYASSIRTASASAYIIAGASINAGATADIRATASKTASAHSVISSHGLNFANASAFIGNRKSPTINIVIPTTLCNAVTLNTALCNSVTLSTQLTNAVTLPLPPLGG